MNVKNFQVFQSFSFALACLACLSCSKYDFSGEVLTHSPSWSFENTFGLKINSIDEIILDENYLNFHQFRQVKQIENSIYYFGVDPQKPKGIEWINLDTQEKGSISFEHPSLFQLGPFYVHSFDSIFFTNEVPPRLWIGDSTGRVFDPYFLEDAPIDWDVPEYYFESLTMAHAPYYEHGKVHFQLSPLDYWDRDKSKFRFMTWFNLNDSTYGPNYGSPEGVYTSVKIEYPYQYSSGYFHIKGDTTVLSFPLDHHLYIYNNVNGQFLGKKEAGSLHMLSLYPPIRKGRLGSQEAQDFFSSAGFYHQLHFHSKLNLFSRVVTHEKELLDLDGKITSECLRTYSIQWFDDRFNLIAESDVPANSFRFLRTSTPTPTGYLAFKPCGAKMAENEFWECISVSPKLN